MPQGSRLTIALLGAPEIDVDGRRLAVDTRKAVALLAYLAVLGRPTRRDTLTALLWPDAPPDRARASLRRTLSTLRSALGGRWLTVDGDSVGLEQDSAPLDVTEFRALLAQSTHDSLVAAVSLSRGDFMQGFGLRDSAAFDDWQQLEGATLRRELAEALDRLAESHAARGETRQAIACAQRRLALDPLHEPAHRLLIGLLARSGDRQGALEQYRACVRVLDRELGVRPLDETTAVYHAVLEGTIAPVPPPPEPALLPAGQPHQLVGRDAELGSLLSAFETVGPDGRVAAIVGEAGIGKTRLTAELARHLESAGSQTIAVRCYGSESGLAYGVVHDLVRSAVERTPLLDAPWWVEEVARVAPELGASPPDALDSPAAQLRLYEAVSELLAHCLQPRGALLVDDAHWADESSLGFLGYLAHRLAGRPLLVVVSWRPDEVSPRDALPALVADAQVQERGEVIELRRLAAREVQVLVDATGRNGELGPRLFRESGGLPFFVVEYLDSLADPGETHWELPVGVRDLLERRLDALGELASQIVAAISVLGGAFDVDTARATSGRGEDETVAGLEELVARGLLTEDDDGMFDFRHEQARELAFARMTLARARLLHRRAAAALEGSRHHELHTARIAHHLAAAGDEQAAAAHYRAAGDEARLLFANAEALAHYQSALALGDPDPAGLQLAVGDLETLAGHYGAAAASYDTAAALAGPELLPEVEHRIGALYARRGEWDLADASFASALEHPGRSGTARLRADRSLAAHYLGREEDARRLAQEALDEAREQSDNRAVAQALNILGILASGEGANGDGVDELERSVALAREIGDTAAEAAALNNLARAVAAAGDLDRATELAETSLAICARLGDRHREAAIRNTLADLLHMAGREEESMEQLKQAVTIFAEIGEHGKLEPEIWKLSEW